MKVSTFVVVRTCRVEGKKSNTHHFGWLVSYWEKLKVSMKYDLSWYGKEDEILQNEDDFFPNKSVVILPST